MKSKYVALTFLLSFGLSAATFAQSKSGIKGGVNFTNMYVSDVDDENMKIGFNAGFYHRAGLSDILDFQTELLFSQKGAALQYDGNIFTGGSGQYRFNLNYIELPLLLMLKAGSFHLHAGPYLGFLVGANIKDVDDDGSIKEISELDRDDFNTFDYGFAGGFGFDFKSGTLGARYNYGFREIGQSGAAGKATADSKNSALQLYVGFDF